MGWSESQDGFGSGGQEFVDRVSNVVEVGLKGEEIVGVEVIECVEVTVELGKGGSEGGDEYRRDAGVGERAHVV